MDFLKLFFGKKWNGNNFFYTFLFVPYCFERCVILGMTAIPMIETDTNAKSNNFMKKEKKQFR